MSRPLTRAVFAAILFVASCDTAVPDAFLAPPLGAVDARAAGSDGAPLGGDAAHVAPDAPTGAADASTPTEDAPLVLPDAPDAPLPDAPVNVPDASVPDATPGGPCPGAASGEPDDVCPGETVGALAPGATAEIDGHALAPAGDVDVFEVPLTALCPSVGVKQYALAAAIGADAAADVHFERFPDDRMCAGALSDAGRSFCGLVTASCFDPPPLPPVIYFQIAAGGAGAVCLPYAAVIHLCAEGSTCDSCQAVAVH